MREESKAANLRDSMAAFLSCSEGRDFFFLCFGVLRKSRCVVGGNIMGSGKERNGGVHLAF